MPKVTLTATQRQDREFLAALRGGQALRGERDVETSQIVPSCPRTYYNRIKKPGKFTLDDIRVLAQRYCFSDRQLCEFVGIEYHGATPK